MDNVPALQPRLGRRVLANQPAPVSVSDLCSRLASLDEAGAWGMLQLLVSDAVRTGYTSAQICAELRRLHNCRSWPRFGSEVEQLLARHCLPSPPPPSPHGPAPKNCNCPPDKDVQVQHHHHNPNDSDWSSACGGYRQPDPNEQSVYFANACEEAKCRGGTRIGLEQIPYEISLAPGANEIVTLGYTRPSRLVAVTFQRSQKPSSNYNPDDWSIAEWRTDKTTQAFDLAREGTTFGGLDPNQIEVPIVGFFEDGANAFSAILHGMNSIPRFIPPNDIGNNNGTARFRLSLDPLAGAPQTAFFRAWIVFLA